jgi:hypothetical protein
MRHSTFKAVRLLMWFGIVGVVVLFWWLIIEGVACLTRGR